MLLVELASFLSSSGVSDLDREAFPNVSTNEWETVGVLDSFQLLLWGGGGGGGGDVNW